MRNRHIAAAITITALALTGCTSTDTSDDAKPTKKAPAAKTPAYKIVEQETSGNTRQVVVEVDSLTGLKDVFTAVTKKLTAEAGYFIDINCSSGGTASVDNRLANGKLARGNMGAAATGLDEDGSEFSTNAGRTCPDKG
ncbi:hypothetical protein G9272_32135 [Streptomyces asoensis]|uniref:Lipoprotein n=1 Tax=Streptomyces asoensis TaxID=249586 RepID=A0A6M4WVV9_9ACTN|nr:hypothetical protein [Streptomyces asoensis]QJT04368.1 hypothetical protein G9272_32135 [Streptomyces asoensis]